VNPRFGITFSLSAPDFESAEAIAEWICLEQSAELPADAITAAHRNAWCGQIMSFTQGGENTWRALITFPVALTQNGISQFLNVLFGNISIGENIRVTGVEWSKLPQFKGPRYGIAGVREKLGIASRPLSCTALKPVGFSTGKLGKLCFQFALGGVDIIKDDHGLADQQTAPFSERLKACQIAVKRAYEDSGNQAVYFPNITADGDILLKRYEEAAAAGCSGVLVSPHLVGLDRLDALRRHPAGLMLMAHPAFSGTLTGKTHGLSHRFLYGELWRALGADFVIYPNTGGRFPYTPAVCADINEGCRDSSLPFPTAFPTPGGGIHTVRVPEWRQRYGDDTVFLIGGSLYKDRRGIEEASRAFTSMLTSEPAQP
jgi:ribulose-bisphosphate carboxylase large chain